MAFVAAEHGEAARERAFARNRIHVLRVAGRRNDLAIVAAVDLMQKAPVPRLRQPEFEAERIMASRRPLRARWLRRKRRRPQARHWPRARRQPRRSARSAGRPIPSSPPRRRGAWRLRRLLRALRRQRERWLRRAAPARRGRSLACDRGGRRGMIGPRRAVLPTSAFHPPSFAQRCARKSCRPSRLSDFTTVSMLVSKFGLKSRAACFTSRRDAPRRQKYPCRRGRRDSSPSDGLSAAWGRARSPWRARGRARAPG